MAFRNCVTACLLWFALICDAHATVKIFPRIFNGFEVEKFKHPWIASLQIYGGHFCGGTLINPTTLLTAAHCRDEKESLLRVLVHRHDLTKHRWFEGGFKFKVVRIINHPLSNLSLANDIAIWKLKLVRGNHRKLPVGLVELNDTNVTFLLLAGAVRKQGAYAKRSYSAQTLCRYQMKYAKSFTLKQQSTKRVLQVYGTKIQDLVIPAVLYSTQDPTEQLCW